MFSKLSKKSALKHILVVSQTNIGDVVLTCPVIDILLEDFPDAKMDVVVGPKAVSLFKGNPRFKVIEFNKRAPLKEQYEWFSQLYKAHYDCVIDLRRTGLALFLSPRYATPIMGQTFKIHKKDTHLDRLRQVYRFEAVSLKKNAIVTIAEDERFFEEQVVPFLQGQSFVVIAPGAADATKRWHPQGFTAVADHLSAFTKVIFVGDNTDAAIVDEIQAAMKMPSLSLAGKINLRQLAYVLKKSSWVIAHDSGVMHLASYLDVPVLALWGPTSLERYAPWSRNSVTVKRNDNCPRCLDRKLKVNHECMSLISVADVINAITQIKQ